MSELSTRAALLCAILLVSACSKQANDNAPGNREQAREALPAATYVGKEACINCHAEESAAWRNSHHDLAMQHVTADTVLGDFGNTSFEQDGVTSRFFTRDGAWWIETDNAHGVLEEFQVAYVFGVTPLQQYLVEFADGRIQTLPIAWDVPKQRWFHVYPDEAIPHTDILHWTGREQNWNYMCAECHSTNLRKNYTLVEDTFDTQWSEINVSCEACHGPASNHVTIAENKEWDGGNGLVVDLDDRADAAWIMDERSGIAARTPSRMSPTAQPEACGRCHSRRGIATENYEFGRPLLDTHIVALLDEHLYFADGQIRDEVYVYGSFLQSKMYRAGVTCTDCHDSHSATLRTDGAVSQVCSSCHLPAKFAVESHHHHEPETLECVDCHMASRDYMVIDGRRDHSFRIPRPALSSAIGVPNACNQCHADQSSEWAESAAVKWYGEAEPGHFALAFNNAHNHALGANEDLVAVITDDTEAGIVRATALTLLSAPLSREQVEVIRQALANPDPLVRLGALRAVPILPPEAHAPLAAPLLGDPVRAVRLGAVEVISPVRQSLDAPFRSGFELAEREYINAQLAIAERPESLANLANLFRNQGDIAQAENFYRHAVAREPRLTGARANLADLYRATQRDDNAEKVLRDGLQLDGSDATLHHVLGLLLVRTGRNDEALDELRQAAELEPDSSRYVYVYAVALNSMGQPDAAIRAIKEANQRFPSDPDIAGLLQSLTAPGP
jgi:Flp pilus assembly protein TadD